ncbi:MAG: Ala-tRNA(Pro) hydrolase [Hyphomicrobiales bacterium]|nr:MAG: Ala-tRNA(Pro) hydrolase [Hyphomicrobiales bacterium]
MTTQLFREDSYLTTCEATVVGVNDRGGIVLDRTIFYPTGGGQLGDSGSLERADGSTIAIATTVYGESKEEIVHVPAEGSTMPEAGEKVVCHVDWPRRYRHMRVHTALHLLSAVLPYPVTGGQISDGDGRLDFDIPEAGIDKDEVTEKVNELIAEDLPVSFEWISDEEMAAQPELVKTMSVKPPMGSGRVRLIRVGEDADLQPCGGTHVAATGEIGRISVTKIEKKGKQNRRVRIRLEETGDTA